MSLFGRKDSKDAELNSSILSADKDGICVYDNAGKIRFSNVALAKMVGYSSPEAMKGANILDVVTLNPRSGKDVGPARDEIINASNNHSEFQSRNYEVVSAKGGTTLAVFMTIAPFELDGERLSLLKLRNMTEELSREQVQAEFISTASHEMRTPVAAIQGYIGLALNPNIATIDPKARHCLESAQEAGKRLGELFQNLLDVSRLEDGRLTPSFSVIEVNDFIRKLATDYEILCQKKEQFFETELDSEKLFVRVDYTFLQDIIGNLLENAIKYTQDGGTIKIKTEVSGDFVTISVMDNGHGISEDDLSHIFQKFYRSQDVNLKVGGTGLGLYLVKQRVEMMHGKIKVKSKIGEGTVFSVSFSRVTKDVEEVNSFNRKEAVPVAQKIIPLIQEEKRTADPFGEDYDKWLRYPSIPPEIGAYPFIKLTTDWREGKVPSTDEKTKEKAYAALRKMNEDVPQEQFDKVWNEFLPRLENPGLAAMMKRFVSRFAIPWLLASPSAVSWEFGFGKGHDFAGNWCEFPKDDMAYTIILRDPVFCWVRERAILARKEIAGKEKVLFLWGGCLPELRDVSSYSMPGETWVCDDDSSINPKEIFGWNTAVHNVHYEIRNAFDYINELGAAGMRFDSIVMNGSSNLRFDSFVKILPEAVKLLKPGGKIMFDILLAHWDIVRAAYVFGIMPAVADFPEFDDAIKRIEKICESLPNVKLEYAVDTGGKTPVGIMFYITLL